MYVIVGLFFLFISVFLEYLIYTEDKYWKTKGKLAFIASIFLVASVLLLTLESNGWLLLVSIVSLYRLLHLARLYINRLPEKRLRSSAIRSFITLSLLQAVIIICWQIFELILGADFTAETALYIFIVAGFISALAVLGSTIYKILASAPRSNMHLSNKELPSVSVCIAARNETPVLTSCLNSVIATEYPKLEILVLDDESQDNTAEIIKSFAHDGVRFVKQAKHQGEWLAKNNAYQTLLDSASGEIVFFMGVDVRLHKKAINGLVEEFLSRDINMMTIIPKRTKSGLLASVIQPMRYWWELAVPEFVYKRKPALSTSWMALKDELVSIGGFKTYKRSIVPEEHLARMYDDINKYAYIRTDKNSLVTIHKDFLRQWDTSVRTRYPHAHRRPETVFLQSFLLFSLVVLPFICFPFALFGAFESPYSYIVIASVVAYLISHVLISVITNPMAGFLAPVNFPIAIVLDIYALHVSMFKYEFSKVIWKGRDIAPKKLKVYKSLPQI